MEAALSPILLSVDLLCVLWMYCRLGTSWPSPAITQSFVYSVLSIGSVFDPPHLRALCKVYSSPDHGPDNQDYSTLSPGHLHTLSTLPCNHIMRCCEEKGTLSGGDFD